jgi:peptidoglycan/xylan/chitin deacetylase (PgdA/CDA1 family)
MEILIILLVVYLLSYLLFTVWGWGSVSWGSRKQPLIALTFDDGPGATTPQLLEILERHQVKATFFLTQSRAERFPQQVEAIRQAGHQIEAHGVWHWPAPLLSPWREWIQISRSPGKFYRPPWGLHSPFTRLLTRWAGKQIALWDTESKDWLPLPAQQIVERMLYYTRPGSILLWHDGPQRTLEALESLLPQFRELGYQMVRLDQLELRPLNFHESLLRAFQGPDERYNLRHGCRRSSFRPFGLMRFAHNRFPYQTTTVQQGVPALEIHLESSRMTELEPATMFRHIRQSLREIALHLEAHPEVEVVYGVGFVAVGTALFGFSTQPLPRSAQWITGLASTWHMWLHRGQLPHRQRGNHQRAAASVGYMEREAFLKRYGPAARPSSPAPQPSAP